MNTFCQNKFCPFAPPMRRLGVDRAWSPITGNGTAGRMATKGRIRSVEQKCVLGKWVSERSLRGQFGLSPRHAEESAECLLQLQTHSPADVTGEGSRKHDGTFCKVKSRRQADVFYSLCLIFATCWAKQQSLCSICVLISKRTIEIRWQETKPHKKVCQNAIGWQFFSLSLVQILWVKDKQECHQIKRYF